MMTFDEMREENGRLRRELAKAEKPPELKIQADRISELMVKLVASETKLNESVDILKAMLDPTNPAYVGRTYAVDRAAVFLESIS